MLCFAFAFASDLLLLCFALARTLRKAAATKAAAAKAVSARCQISGPHGVLAVQATPGVLAGLSASGHGVRSLGLMVYSQYMQRLVYSQDMLRLGLMMYSQ